MNNIDEKEAELVGIILGDGHLDPFTYGTIITCGSIDLNYITRFIPSLIEEIFLKKTSIIFLKNKKGRAIQCRLYSKSVFLYMNNMYNIKIGKKINMKIPDMFFYNQNLLKSCIRGMIDTDGGLYRHHKRSLQIVFFNNDFVLINSLSKALRILGYKPRMTHEKRGKYHLDLFTEDCKKYVKDIGFNNPKNIIKYNYWLKNGRIPNNSEIKDAVAGI